ncbi:MAG: hypothetical protein IJS96_10570 [Schwartzia sp.]|nr:hypothetical protein [Schwartzia sp. (in: firmicutes)]
MGYLEDIRALAERIAQFKDTVTTKEATKLSMIVPFFAALGYDMTNPREVMPGYAADFGTKKGEPVDYAIMDEAGKPLILIEAMRCGENLDQRGSWLFRYYASTPAKIYVLTNGLLYHFIFDIKYKNKMDSAPFLELDMLHLNDEALAELENLQRDAVGAVAISDPICSLKYCREIRQIFARQLKYPDDDFVKYFMNIIYRKTPTRQAVDAFRGLVKLSLDRVITDTANAKVNEALARGATCIETTVDSPGRQEAGGKLYIRRAAYIARTPAALTAAQECLQKRDAGGFGRLERAGQIFVFDADTPITRCESIGPAVVRVDCPVADFSSDDVYTYKNWILEKS